MSNTIDTAYWGAVAAVGAAFTWAISLILFQSLGGKVPAYALNLLKSSIAAISLGVLLLFLPSYPWPAVTEMGWLALSGLIGVCLSDSALFAGLSRVGTSLTSASFSLAPPIATLLAFFFMGESLRPVQAWGIVLVLGATLSLVACTEPLESDGARITKGRWRAGLGFLLLAQVSNASAIVLGRYALGSVDIVRGTLIRIVPSVFLLLGMTLWRYRKRDETRVWDSRRFAWLCLASWIGSFLGLLLMTAGMKYTQAGVSATLNSTTPLWVVVFGVFALRQKVHWPSLACILTALVGIGLILLA